MKMLDLFSGIGGFSLAARWAGIDTVGFCEIDTYCQKVLKKNFPETPIFSDIKKIKGDDINETIDIITGGFPCQPFSIAGRKRGTEDDRDLWPEMFRVIQDIKPTWIIGENVANFLNMAFHRTKTDLEGEGYEVQPFIIPACGVGAPHRRDRVFIVAHKKKEDSFVSHPPKIRRYRSKIKNNRRYKPKGKQSRYQGRSKVERHIWESEPCMDRVAARVPNRLDRVGAIGNSVIPQVAYQILKGIKEVNK